MLVESVKDSDRPRVMLSDFGFSVIPCLGQEQVEIVVATTRYTSLEVFRCLQGKAFTTPRNSLRIIRQVVKQVVRLSKFN